MYSGIQKIETVIDYIESNITEELDCEFLAKMMNLSVYEFRRIFSFVVGEIIDALAVVFIVLIDLVMGTIQEYSAVKKAMSLENIIKVKCKVLRDKQEIITEKL